MPGKDQRKQRGVEQYGAVYVACAWVQQGARGERRGGEAGFLGVILCRVPLLCLSPNFEEMEEGRRGA